MAHTVGYIPVFEWDELGFILWNNWDLTTQKRVSGYAMVLSSHHSSWNNTGWWFGTCFIFPFSWECHHPNWRTHIFQRGGPTTNQNRCYLFFLHDFWLCQTFLSHVPTWNGWVISTLSHIRCWSFPNSGSYVVGHMPRSRFDKQDND